MKPSIITRVANQVRTWKPFFLEEKLKEPSKTDKKRISYQIQKHKVSKFDVEQDDLKTAIDMATDEYDPRRTNLHLVYREAKRNLNLLCEMTNAYDDVLQQGGALFNKETGEMAEEETKLFKKRWFEKAVRIYLSDEFEGFKVLEIGELIETENGWEIKNVKEFPVYNVLPERGLLIAHPDAQIGLPFRPTQPGLSKENIKLAEAVSEWLIECGDPENLGLLSIAAKEAIYNKWGLGDWARSSEKWMDPTTIIKSGTDDKKENDKKAAAASNLGNNNWMILDDSDEVELLERRNVAAYSITKEFLEYNDKSIARGLNGQIATTDEKAFVGSAEVQERIKIKRTRRRSRSVTYWLNEDMIPKLISLNGGDSAYKALEGLEWRYFDFDGEDDGEDTDPEQGDDPKENGKPKAKTKQPGGAGVGKPQTQNASEFHTNLTNLYAAIPDPGLSHYPHNSRTLETLAQKMADKIYQRKIRPGQISGELTEAQARELIQVLKTGYAETLTNPKFASPEHRLRSAMQYNIHVMAAFKNHQNVMEVHALLFDQDGKIKPKAQFLKDIKSINADYNKHWAASEHRLAKGQAQMTDKYLLYKDRGGSFVYVSMNDGKVRPEHEELHGLTAPVDHPIWDSVLPKNGWGCRCWFRWIKDAVEKISEQSRKFAEDLPDMFKNNPAKTGKIFTENHPYFEIASQFLEQAQKLFGYKPPINMERFDLNMALFETIKENAAYQLKHSHLDTGGFVFAHKAADARDLAANLKAGKKLADKGYAVEIREHIHRDGIKNPELGLNGAVTDLKTPEKVSGIKSAFNTARKQDLDTVVIDVNGRWERKQIIDHLDAGFHYNSEIQKAVLIYKGDVIEITRNEWKTNALESVLP